MQLPQVIQSRKVESLVALIALVILVILIVEVFLQFGRSPRTFELDNMYGLLD
jgi:hypothetical protein